MRLWIIHQHAIPPIKMGPTRHYDLAKKLIEKGHEVYILSSNYCHNNFHVIAEPYRTTKKIDYYHTVPFIWFDAPKYTKNSLQRLWNMLVFAYSLISSQDLQFLPRPDIIIGSSPSPFAAYAAWKIAKRFNVPFIYEIRDLWPETLISLGQFSRYHPLTFLLKKLENHLVKRCKKIIAVLPGIQAYFAPKAVSASKILNLPNFTNIEDIPYSPMEANEQITVVYAGSYNIANDVETLLNAAYILQQTEGNKYVIRLIGDGPEKKTLARMIEKNNLKNVQFLPMVPKDQIFSYLLKADILVGLVKNSELYKWGTSLNKISDYFAVGRPVIFCIDSPYDPITEANAGLTVKPENAVALADAIREIGSLPLAARNALGMNARRYAEDWFNLDKKANELLAELKQLV